MTKKEVFKDIITLLKEKGKKYKKRVGYYYVYNFNGGYSLVYDNVFGFMSLESGHNSKYGQETYFGDKVKMEMFFGEINDIQSELKYLVKVKEKII